MTRRFEVPSVERIAILMGALCCSNEGPARIIARRVFSTAESNMRERRFAPLSSVAILKEQPRHSCVGGRENGNETVCSFDCDIDPHHGCGL